MPTRIVVSVRNLPGILHKVLGAFATRGIQVADIFSESSDTSLRGRRFVVIIEANQDDRNLEAALEELDYFSTNWAFDNEKTVNRVDVDFEAVGTEFSVAVQLAASSLSDVLDEEILELRACLPNEIEAQKTHLEVLDFYDQIQGHLTQILAISSSEKGSMAAVQREVGLFHRSLTKFVETHETNETVRKLTSTTMIGGSFAFLAFCGVPAVFAAPTVIATFAGPKVFERFRQIWNSKEEGLDSD